MVCVLESEKIDSSGEPGIRLPKMLAAKTPAAPISEASTTLPLRMRYIQRLTKNATGIVQTMVNVPHELPGICWMQPAGNVNEWSFRSALRNTPGATTTKASG